MVLGWTQVNTNKGKKDETKKKKKKEGKKERKKKKKKKKSGIELDKEWARAGVERAGRGAGWGEIKSSTV